MILVGLLQENGKGLSLMKNPMILGILENKKNVYEILSLSCVKRRNESKFHYMFSKITIYLMYEKWDVILTYYINTWTCIDEKWRMVVYHGMWELQNKSWGLILKTSHEGMKRLICYELSMVRDCCCYELMVYGYFVI